MPADTESRRRAPWVVIAGALVVVVAAALVGWVQLQRPGDPEQTATRFWQLLADGKAQEALALTPTPAASVPNGLLLSDAMYGRADRGIAGVRAHSFVRRGDEASGTVAYTQHGRKRSAHVELALARQGLTSRPSWQVTNPPLARIEVTAASGGHADALAVDGKSLPLPGGDGRIAVPALPGSYTFALGDSSGLFTPVPQKVDVTGAAAAVTLGLSPSSRLGTQAVAQAQQLLNGCFAQPTLAPDCALATGIRNIFDLTAEPSVTYALTRAPQLAFDGKTMKVASTADGEITTTQSDPRNGYFHNVAQFSLVLDVAVRGGRITLTPEQGGVHNTDGVCINAAC
jgi:hypothetical protein